MYAVHQLTALERREEGVPVLRGLCVEWKLMRGESELFVRQSLGTDTDIVYDDGNNGNESSES